MSITASVPVKSLDEAVGLALRQLIDGGSASLKADTPFTREEFERFCRAYPELQAELSPEGHIEVMSPQTLLSNHNEGIASARLYNWWFGAREGLVLASNAGFTLPSGAVRSPDAAWVSAATLAAAAPEELQRMGEMVPDFVIEVMSKGDALEPSRTKMARTWRASGVRLGWLIDPRRRRSYVYRAGEDGYDTVDGFERHLDAHPVVPGFRLDLRDFVVP